MARPTKQTRKRKWAPKVRSGCKTCKIRRKRCDETKPVCMRCVQGGYKCDGYDAASTTPKPRQRDQQPSCSGMAQVSLCTEAAGSSSRNTDLNDMQLSIIGAAHDVGGFLNEPSNPLSTDIDGRYSTFFHRIVVPVLSTTRQWHSFWSMIVPQASWDNHCLHHAMVALAATYEAKTAKIDRSDLIASRVSLAIRSFSTQPVSPDVALIFCRLLSSMAQSTGDWQSAVLHLRSGSKILKEAAHTYQATSDIAKLLAPVFLGVSTSIDIDSDCLNNVPQTKKRHFVELTHLYARYGGLLRLLNREQWRSIEMSTTSFILISWSIMTQAMASIAHPDVLVSSPGNALRSPAEVKSQLLESGQLLSFQSLQSVAEILLEDLSCCVAQPDSGNYVPKDFKHRLQCFTENFLVQAAEIQPNMAAGTFWPEGPESGCSITCLIRGDKMTTSERGSAGVGAFGETVHRVSTQVDHSSIPERQQWYNEYVCPYRSGFIPAFLGPSFTLTRGGRLFSRASSI
ncbi:hypothetical protein HRR77_009454 [Exophiala dermatitidis]|nr:hypothetical protein HRR77_009454 [Exophiala dermatitidis]KAJ4696367.1 hypothetical protein HRR87_002963 [Exophiala dermatitidis]KAJ9001019.1 hypothetical protein HRR94_004283 [Exophiala dermatitidis]